MLNFTNPLFHGYFVIVNNPDSLRGKLFENNV
jgi:hypothetical protein